MLIHDSLSIEEQRESSALARQEYLPDFTFGLEYITSPTDGFRGWSVMAGISLPFAPWTLGRVGGRVDEADATLKKAGASYQASRAMVTTSVRDLYYRASAGKEQLTTFRLAILPQARMSLQASQAAYQTGKTDFFMLIDAYRTLVSLTREYFMTRMQFEQTKAELERAVGTSLNLKN
jgi:cobalt-zinc-cadmium efflux system outer membrane protein